MAAKKKALGKRKPPPPPKGRTRRASKDEFGLSLQQRAFADNYLVVQNATRAYIAAGYRASSDAVAASAASELLRKPNVAKYIETRLRSLHDKLEITQERVLKEVARIAYADPLAYYNPDGSVKALAEMSEDARRAITEIELDDKGKPVKVKAAGKGVALDKLMRYLQLYKEAAGGIVIPPPAPGTTTEVRLKVSAEESYRRMLGG